MSLGPIMLDVVGTTLSTEDKQRLLHPLVGGVILFSRNFENCEQLNTLTSEIHALRQPPLLIAVDHEGGRVQRFKEGFTHLPPMRAFGHIWDKDSRQAKQLAEEAGWVLATELRAFGIDFSFTPVLDMDYGDSAVIGDRAFHQDMRAINDLASRLMLGMKKAGMAAVGKHFPGHGYVAGDSHVSLPVDERSFDQIAQQDLQPFRMLIDNGIQAMMPAHVIYQQVDDKPAGFSERWLQKVLRQRLAFNGAIFSDDLSMEAAAAGGDVTTRALAALQAGCDMVLLCNQPAMADTLLAQLQWDITAPSLCRLARMHGQHSVAQAQAQQKTAAFAAAVQRLKQVAMPTDLFDPTDRPLGKA